MQRAGVEPGLVGRNDELAEIDGALTAVRDGGSAVLAIVGEPGIGKSALLAEARERAEAADVLPLDGRAAEHEADVPFGLAIDALDDRVAGMGARRLESLGPAQLSELAAVLPAAAAHAEPARAQAGPAERFRYHRAVRALLELIGGERPPALLLDDVHWADDASLELLLHLLRRPPRVPHLLALGLRPTGEAPRLLDALRSVPGARLLTLEPLPRDAALALLTELGDPGARDRIEREAGGNPLYLQELARVAGDPATQLPPTLVAAVQLEVASLPPASRALLDGASVAGDPFDPELAAAAGGLDATDALVPLDRLVAADLVRPLAAERRFRFRHPLVRRAVYDAAPAGWRLAAHERAAEALAARGAGAATRAYHVEASARPGDEAAVQLLAEAAASSTSSSPAVAARWYGAALRLLPEGDPGRAPLLGPLAAAQAASGEVARSRETLLEALALLPAREADARRSLTIACAQLERLLGRHSESVARLERALGEADEPLARATVELQLGMGAVFASDHEGVRRWGAQSLESAGGRDPGIVATGEALVAFGALWGLRAGEWEGPIERSLAAHRALPDEALAGHLEGPWALSSALVLSPAYRTAAEICERGVAVATAFGRGEMLVPFLVNRSMAHLNLLELPEALEAVDTADEIARLQRLSDQLLFVLWQRVIVLDALGDAAGALEASLEARRLIAEAEPSVLTINGASNIATIELERDPEGCVREIVAAAGPELERAEPAWAVTFLAQNLTEATLALGRPDEAESWAALAERNAAAGGLPHAQARATTARAAVTLAAGDAEEAAALAAAAVAQAEAIEDGYDALKARYVAGSALAAAGRRDEAVAELRLAAEQAARGSAGKVADQIARTLRELGESVARAAPRPGGSHGFALLTEREREISGLVAQGQSNKEVAAALFLSEKTVEKHLSRAFGKLGVRSRGELAATFARRGD